MGIIFKILEMFLALAICEGMSKIIDIEDPDRAWVYEFKIDTLFVDADTLMYDTVNLE